MHWDTLRLTDDEVAPPRRAIRHTQGLQHEITEKVRALADRFGVGRTNVLRRRTRHERARAVAIDTPRRSARPPSTQLSLL